MLIYIVIGVMAGLLSGLLGVGGGIITVPALLYTYSFNHFPPTQLMQYAAGTSFAAMLIISCTSTYHYYLQKQINWDTCRKVLPTLLLGIILSSTLASHIVSQRLSTLFALFLLAIAIQLWRGTLLERHEMPPIAATWLGLGGLLIGSIAGLFGIGGSIMLIPFLTYFGTPIKKAIATSSVCTFSVACMGSLSYMITGLHQPAPNWGIIGYVNWPAALLIGISAIIFVKLGVKITLRLHSEHVKKIFIILLVVMSLKILLT